MVATRMVLIADIHLDLDNFRTVKQASEESAIHAMVSISSTRFWALCDSFIADGILSTENIIVIDMSGRLVVKEGNRRVAALKLLHDILPSGHLTIPTSMRSKISTLTTAWKQVNEKLPCAIYSQSEILIVKKIVKLAHAKGQDAGRDPWNAVAKAREHRDSAPTSEPALDLLENYLKHGSNLTLIQKEKWAGDYSLSVLDEVVKRFHALFGASNARNLADLYPSGQLPRNELEQLLLDIGVGSLGFDEFRDGGEPVLAARYGLSSPPSPSGQGTLTPSMPSSARAASPRTPAPSASSGGVSGSGGGISSPSSNPSSPAPSVIQAASLNDPASVKRKLRSFHPVGNGREKVVTLLNEMKRLKLDKHPLAFCFLLRSMFEISAKAYCADHQASGGPSTTNSNGRDKSLADVLTAVHTHMLGNPVNSAIQRNLHGSMTEISNSTGFLSVTSMNQLVHNPSFSIDQSHICVVFNNVFPLLNQMNS